jgi:hypothetical protein
MHENKVELCLKVDRAEVEFCVNCYRKVELGMNMLRSEDKPYINTGEVN